MPADDDLDFGATIKGYAAGQQVFDRYTLKKILGRGGMGLVWLAHDEKLERDIALKFLPELVALDERAINDLKRETRRALDLTHPHIVRIYDFVDDDRSAAIAMEWVDGATLSKLALDCPHEAFNPEQISAWVSQLCGALDYAHNVAQVVHRDLKPANLMIDARDHLKIADFGISATLSDSTTRVSKQAGTSGTPLYMSPQQMMGEKPAATDDIYALGATLYELLTGKPPFYSGKVEMQVMNKVPPSLTERREEFGIAVAGVGDPGGLIPLHWEETIAACLAKEPGDRPQSAGEVWQRLSGKFDGHKEASSSVLPGGTMADKHGTKTGRQDEAGHGEHGGDPEVTEKVSSFVPKGGTKADKQADEGDLPSKIENSKSKIPAMLGIAAAGAIIATAGWWFGVEQPKRAAAAAEIVRLEEARIAAEEEAAKVELARIEREKKEADRLERERLAAEAAEAEKRSDPRFATKEAPYENTLGMKFVPVPEAGVLFSIWETRVQDFEAFVKETAYDATARVYSPRNGEWWTNGDTWQSPGFSQSGTHPVVGMAAADAKGFCAWLTQKEKAEGRLTADQEYRLPTDEEWDLAVGPETFPWGEAWPPPRGAGNYQEIEIRDEKVKSDSLLIEGINDGYAWTSPVGSFAANRYGIYDLGGNVWERVEGREYGLRGASFYSETFREYLSSSYRYTSLYRNVQNGFRVVCVVGSVR